MHYAALLIFYLALGLQGFGDALTPAPLTSPQSFGSVSCGGGFEVVGVAGKSAGQSSLKPQEVDECTRLQQLGRALFEDAKYQLAYDTLRHYVETCNAHIAPFAISFGDLTMSNHARNDDPIDSWNIAIG